MGLADVFVVGFAWGRFAGGICFVIRRPNMILRQGTIEALVRVAAATIERKRSAELAQLQAIKLDLALSAAEIGAWELDLVTGKRHFDARVCDLLGIERATFGGTREEFYRAVHPEDQEGLCVALRRTIDEDTAYAVEYRAVWPDGSVHWLSGRGTRLYDAEGRPTVINGLLWDITARKLADEILRESEDKFRHLFEHSIIGMCITQLTGEMTVNRAFCEMLGYGPGELDNTNLQTITHPDDAALTAREFDAVLTGEKPFTRFEKRYLTKNGSMVWVDLASSLRRDAAGKPLYLMTSVVEITQRKLAEREVYQANTFLDSIVENIPNMLFLKDARELRFVRLNRAGEELLGHSKADLAGKNDYDFFPMEHADFFTRMDREVLQAGKIVDIPEEPLQTKTNGQRTLHTKKVPIPGPTGEPEYLLGISEDITDRKLAEQANLEQMDELRRWHEVTLGRETRIIELKREVNELLAKLGQPVRYTSTTEDADG
jgi:PAS domain S-box-containing protein